MYGTLVLMELEKCKDIQSPLLQCALKHMDEYSTLNKKKSSYKHVTFDMTLFLNYNCFCVIPIIKLSSQKLFDVGTFGLNKDF